MKPRITKQRGGWVCEGSGECAWGESPSLSFRRWHMLKKLSDAVNRALGRYVA